MDNKLDVGVAAADANRAFRGRPWLLCLPLLLMYVTFWAFGQTLRWGLPKGAYGFLLLLFCVLVPLAESWLIVLVSAMALEHGPKRTLGHVTGIVAAIPPLWGLIGRLYGRLVAWCLVSVIATGAFWFVALIVASIARGVPHHHSPHEAHPTTTWLTIMAFYAIFEVFFSRYAFVLPMAAILRRGDVAIFEYGLMLGRAHRGIVIAAAVANWAVVILPGSALTHFTRHQLEASALGTSAVQLLSAIVYALGATWFVLLRLYLTQQALAKSSSGTATT
jgi:hypothetical protein